MASRRSCVCVCVCVRSCSEADKSPKGRVVPRVCMAGEARPP